MRSTRHSLAVLTRLAPIAVALLIAGCTSTTPIKTLLDDPGSWNNKTVNIEGDVSSAMGVLGYGAYKLNDGTGSILVVTKSGGAPRDGAKVGVRGVFHNAFTLGTESVAAVEETKRVQP
jgi:hypothetical protein